MAQNGDYGPTVRDMNKCHKTGPPINWVALQNGHIILGGCVNFFQKLQKTPPKMVIMAQRFEI